MRRLRARPAGDLLLAMGSYSPWPLATRRSAGTEAFSARKRTTLVARAVDSSQLVGNCSFNLSEMGALSVDVVVAQNQLVQARSNYYVTIANYLNAKLDLEVAAAR